MITKMLIEIFQAIIEDPAIKRLLGNFDTGRRSDIDLETLMDELELDAEERAKFKQAYQEYQENPYESYERYKYKYEPKSSSPFDKFESYFNKYDDWAKETEEKYGKGTGDWRHRQYQKYRNQYNRQSGYTSNNTISDEEKKHAETLEIKPNATFDEVKSAYKNAMKKYHPDKFSEPQKKKYAEEISRKINGAYDYYKKKFNK